MPDKRTALYEEYMKIFLNREVEKKQIAGNHRDLILSIHGLLAWVLQVQAETGQGSGSITKDELKTEVKAYLESEEYEPTLADNLLQGTVERVGALVSRVQGTFEFEVQPLREYFAARHLHKTAPYSPPGSPKRGTRPERFATLCKSFYWTNVTRFFCGFYDVGELPSLVDGIIELAEETGYSSINQPRQLAIMLLGDHVFTQSPKSVRRLIEFVTEEPGFQRMIDGYDAQDLRGMSLPKTAGRKMLFGACVTKLNQEQNPVLHRGLRQVIAMNADRDELKSVWQTRFNENRMVYNPLIEARDFRVTRIFTIDEIKELTRENLDLRLQWFVSNYYYDHIINDAVLYAKACRAFFAFKMRFPNRGRHSAKKVTNPLIILTVLLNPFTLADMVMIPENFSFRSEQLRIFKRIYAVGEDPVAELAQFVVELMETSTTNWDSDLAPWSSLVDRGFEVAPHAHLFAFIALISTAVTNQQTNNSTDPEFVIEGFKTDANVERSRPKGQWGNDGFAATPGLVERIYFARNQTADSDWWRNQLDNCVEEAQIILLSTLICWCEPGVLKTLGDRVSSILEALDTESWSSFWQMFCLIVETAELQVSPIDEGWFMNEENLSPRFAIALAQRLDLDADRRVVIRKCFYRYEGCDPQILWTAAGSELSSDSPEDIDWLYLKRLSMLARKHRINTLLPYGDARHNIDVPSDVAEEVLNACELHNSEFVNLCESSFSSRIAKSASTVVAVSEKEKWFTTE